MAYPTGYWQQGLLDSSGTQVILMGLSRSLSLKVTGSFFARENRIARPQQAAV